MRKHWKKIVVAVAGVLVVADIGAGIFFYNLAIKRGPKDFLEGNSDLEVSQETMDELLEGKWRQWVRGQDFEELSMKSRDGIELRGYYLAAKKPTDKLVILTHGYLGHAKQMGLYGQYYHDVLGYNIFMPDARGHGDSAGDYYGFGWPDRLDLIDWTKKLLERDGADTKVVYHGLSMGAATVLMASGEKDLPKAVKAIIADSPYTDVYNLFAYQMKRMYHLPAFPVLDTTSVVTNMRAGYRLREASALKEVERSDVPMLIIHGKADTFVPTRMAQELQDHAGGKAELMLIDDANHGEGYVKEKARYQKRLEKFLRENVQ
ncbi:alpha/beta hydrolase [Aciduricibacillus chroicocephali]|uniref:alpha/beta hydrolase n=1 Tax=Aciduricibacillus chroicocephali TaxID=3054939 RepID=UPI0032678DA8